MNALLDISLYNDEELIFKEMDIPTEKASNSLDFKLKNNAFKIIYNNTSLELNKIEDDTLFKIIINESPFSEIILLKENITFPLQINFSEYKIEKDTILIKYKLDTSTHMTTINIKIKKTHSK